MKVWIVGVFAGLLLAGSTPARAKVCYRCKGNRPVKYVCSARDTFRARRNARKLGCQWTSYTSSCNCGAWVAHKSVGFVHAAQALLAPRRFEVYPSSRGGRRGP